jgi:predicted alpha/beta hydrolase
MSARNNESLHGYYPPAPREMKRNAPQSVGAAAVGHVGFFRRRFADTLWPHAGEWLRRHAAQA